MSNKQKMEVTPPKEEKVKGLIITEAEVQETIKNLQAQLLEPQSRALMLQGAIQVQQQMLEHKETTLANGQKENGIEGA